MAESGERITNLFLRYASAFSGLRRVPVLGSVLSWTSRQLVPRDALIWVQIRRGPGQGLWIRVNPRTGRDTQEGVGELSVQEALRKHLRPGMIFYDLGANIGFFSLLAARMVGSAGGVVSFEADPEIAARLRENLARNDLTHASVVQKAVWSEPGNVSFARVDADVSPDRGLGRVSTGDAATNTICVEAVALDEFTMSHPAPDLLKCDVEGAECAVFRGAERLLREKHPILLVEMHSPENQQELTQMFASLGYSCSALDDNHVLALYP